MCDEPDRLPEWIVDELRRPIPVAAGGPARIMGTVRAWSRGWSRARPRAARRAGGRRRFGLMPPAIGLAVAAAMTAVVVGAGLVPGGGAARVGEGRATIIGDSMDAALHDTLRLVQFVLHAPAASRVALVGDFNGWNAGATPLGAGARAGSWSTVVALPRGRYHYAFVVDDTRWVAVAAAGRDRESRGRPRSTIVIGDST